MSEVALQCDGRVVESVNINRFIKQKHQYSCVEVQLLHGNDTRRGGVKSVVTYNLRTGTGNWDNGKPAHIYNSLWTDRYITVRL